MLGVLVNKPFRKLVKVTKIVDGHTLHKYHSEAVEAALTFKKSVEQPQVNDDVRLNMELVNTIRENRHILKFALSAFCAVGCSVLL